MDAEEGADGLGAVAHRVEAHAGRAACGGGGEAGAVVGDGEDEVALGAGEFDGDGRAAGVADGVGDGLLGDAIEVDGGTLEGDAGEAGVAGAGDAVEGADGVAELVEGVDEAVLAEDHGVERLGDLADLEGAGGEVLAELGEVGEGDGFAAAGGALEGLGEQEQAGELLADAVVEVAAHLLLGAGDGVEHAALEQALFGDVVHEGEHGVAMITREAKLVAAVAGAGADVEGADGGVVADLAQEALGGGGVGAGEEALQVGEGAGGGGGGDERVLQLAVAGEEDDGFGEGGEEGGALAGATEGELDGAMEAAERGAEDQEALDEQGEEDEGEERQLGAAQAVDVGDRGLLVAGDDGVHGGDPAVLVGEEGGDLLAGGRGGALEGGGGGGEGLQVGVGVEVVGEEAVDLAEFGVGGLEGAEGGVEVGVEAGDGGGGVGGGGISEGEGGLAEALAEHALAAGEVEDVGAGLLVPEGAVDDDLAADREGGDGEQGQGVAPRERAARGFEGLLRQLGVEAHPGEFC